MLKISKKQNPDESCATKYQNHDTWSYGYKLVRVDDKFSKYFKSYWNKDAFNNFIKIMIEESKYCTDIMKKHFSKELLTTKKIVKILRNLLNVGFVVMIMLKAMLK